MSQVSPPKEDVPIYNSLNYYGQGDDDKLNFPIAQGPEVMAQGVYWGDGTFQNTANPGASGSFVQYPTAQGRVDFGTGPGFGISFGAAVQDTPYTGMTTATGTHEPASVTLDGNGQITAISSVNTDINYVLTKGTDAGTLGITNVGQLTQPTTISPNSLGPTHILNPNGATAGSTVEITDQVSSNTTMFIPNISSGSWNPASITGQQAIIAKGATSNQTLQISSWSGTNNAVLLTPTTVKIQAGSSTSTPSTSVECDGTTVQIDPTLTVDTNALILEAGLSSTYTLLGNSAITAGTYLSILNPGSTATFALEQLTAGDNGSQSIIITSGGAFGATKNTIQSYDSYRNSALDLYLNPLGGDVFVPTPSTSDNSTKIASTAYVKNNLASYETTANAAATYAPLVSPGLTGVPTAPTAVTSTNTTQIATTQYVKSNLVGYETTANAAATYAPLVSPALTGTPTAPTQISTDNSTKIATTAFVQSHAATGYAPIDSPNFTGIPTAPTPAASVITNQLATASFTHTVTAQYQDWQPFAFNYSGYFYANSGGVYNGAKGPTISFGLTGSTQQNELATATFRVTTSYANDLKSLSGGQSYFNAFGSNTSIVTIWPGRLTSGYQWGPYLSNQAYYLQNSGGDRTGNPYTIFSSSGTSGAIYTRQLDQYGSQISSNSFLAGYGREIQFCCSAPANLSGVMELSVELLSFNFYYQGTATYTTSGMSGGASGSRATFMPISTPRG